MLIRKTSDWKRQLTPADEKELNDILRAVQKHRSAYRQSADVRTAQLWAAVLELHKENERLLERLRGIEYIFDGMIERIRKQEREKREIRESLDTF